MRRGGGRRRMDELSGLSIILILPRGREGKEAETSAAGRSAMVVAARLENSLLQYSAVAAERQRLPFMPSSGLT